MDDTFIEVEKVPPGDYRFYRIALDERVRAGTFWLSDTKRTILCSPYALIGQAWNDWWSWYLRFVRRQVQYSVQNIFDSLRLDLGLPVDYRNQLTPPTEPMPRQTQVPLVVS